MHSDPRSVFSDKTHGCKRLHVRKMSGAWGGVCLICHGNSFSPHQWRDQASQLSDVGMTSRDNEQILLRTFGLGDLSMYGKGLLGVVQFGSGCVDQ